MTFKAPVPTPPGLWRRVPPAVFPPIMGLFGLGLAWRQGGDVFVLPRGIAETILGAVALLFVFACLAYAVKLLRRPSVIVDDLRILPGRAGVAAMVLSIYLLSMTLAPYSMAVGQALLVTGLSVHAALVVLLVHQFVTGPAEQRRVTPVWHLSYVGFIIGALAATVFEFYLLALVLFIATTLLAGVIWSVSLEQVIKETVPAPLRPLLAIHLAPVALIGLVAAALELDAVAMGCAGIAAMMMAALVLRVGWLTQSGFSALWGAFTFPLAATANLWLTVGGIWRWPGGIALVAATLIVPMIAFKVIRLWAGGQLAVKTNAAVA